MESHSYEIDVRNVTCSELRNIVHPVAEVTALKAFQKKAFLNASLGSCSNAGTSYTLNMGTDQYVSPFLLESIPVVVAVTCPSTAKPPTIVPRQYPINSASDSLIMNFCGAALNSGNILSNNVAFKYYNYDEMMDSFTRQSYTTANPDFCSGTTLNQTVAENVPGALYSTVPLANSGAILPTGASLGNYYSPMLQHVHQSGAVSGAVTYYYTFVLQDIIFLGMEGTQSIYGPVLPVSSGATLSINRVFNSNLIGNMFQCYFETLTSGATVIPGMSITVGASYASGSLATSQATLRYHYVNIDPALYTIPDVFTLKCRSYINTYVNQNTYAYASVPSTLSALTNSTAEIDVNPVQPQTQVTSQLISLPGVPSRVYVWVQDSINATRSPFDNSGPGFIINQMRVNFGGSASLFAEMTQAELHQAFSINAGDVVPYSLQAGYYDNSSVTPTAGNRSGQSVNVRSLQAPRGSLFCIPASELQLPWDSMTSGSSNSVQLVVTASVTCCSGKCTGGLSTVVGPSAQTSALTATQIFASGDITESAANSVYYVAPATAGTCYLIVLPVYDSILTVRDGINATLTATPFSGDVIRNIRDRDDVDVAEMPAIVYGGNWWDSFKHGISKAAHWAWDNRDAIAKVVKTVAGAGDKKHGGMKALPAPPQKHGGASYGGASYGGAITRKEIIRKITQ